jgi:hypothetical protein
MSEQDENHLSDVTEERGPLARVKSLAPLLSLILQALELLLKVLGIIK